MGLGIKTLLDSPLPQLSLLLLFQFCQLPLLIDLLLLVVILVSLQGDHDIEQFLSLGFQLVRVHGIKGKGLDSDGEGDLLLLLQLLLGLGHLLVSITGSLTNNRLLGTSASLLGIQHLLSLGFCLFKLLLLLFSLHSLPLSFLLPGLLLLGSDLLPLSLLLLQLLQLLLLLLPGLPPF